MHYLARFFLAASCCVAGSAAQEAAATDVIAPDVLRMQGGEKVESPTDWWLRRRPEIRALFDRHVYGRIPPAPDRLRFEVLDEDTKARGGTATRRQITVHFGVGDREGSLDLLLYIPNDRDVRPGNLSPPSLHLPPTFRRQQGFPP